jgi:hypothetical protein
MGKSYSAYGLALRSAFPLAGMTPADGEGLPKLELYLETPAELRAAWRGIDGAGSWRGRLSDGNELTIERGRAGSLLFSYGELAQFRLDLAAGRLGCAPVELEALDWQRVLLGRVLPHAGIAFGREALHAAAVETSLGVVAIAAPGGMGKSTLAAELVRRGHRFFCDDVLVFDGAGTVEAYPGSPHMNLELAGGAGTVARRPSSGSTLGVLSGERWVVVGEAASRPAPVAAVVLLERAAGLRLEARSLPTSPLTLAPFMLGLPDDEGRDGARFALYSDLVESAAILHLGGDSGNGPGDFAATLERALGLGAAAADRSAA